jgi:predicted MFS family arabinose efflux permease
MKKLISRINRDYLLFFLSVGLYGFGQSTVDSTFNNFLNETFGISDFQRGFLELPRELPGFLVVFVSALFAFMCTRRLAALANLLAGAGILLMGLYSPEYSIMIVWLFVHSIGLHLFMPLNSSIGMEFAEEGKTGKKLGQLNGAMNLAAITGSFIVFVGFRYLDFTFTVSFVISSIAFITASLLLFWMKPDDPLPARTKFTLRKEYRLFYWLNILYGTRKQIFLTFGPWVLVTIFKQKTQMVATLLFIGGLIGIFFKPLLGRWIDRFGEKVILMGEAMVLIFVCIGYGFSRHFLSEGPAMMLAFSCYIIDQLLMSVGMARATYLHKIAVKPEDVSQTLTMGLTIDHIFSISIALVSGLLWVNLGYEYVFLLGAVIAVINLFSASRIVIGARSG